MYSKIIIMRLAEMETKMIPERPTFDGKSLSLTFFNDIFTKVSFMPRWALLKEPGPPLI